MASRQELLESLFTIKFENIDSDKSKEAQRLIKLLLSNQGIEEASKFVSDHLDRNYAKDFFSRLSSKKFYKTLSSMDEETSAEVIIKAISSLITHAVIDIEKHNAPRSVVNSKLELEKLVDIISIYLRTGSLPDYTYETISNLIN